MPDCRYYQIGGMTVQVESDLPINETTFEPKFKCFEVAGRGEANVVIRHHFALLNLEKIDLGQRMYRKAPWAVYRKGDNWIYLLISAAMKDTEARDMGVLSADYTHAEIFHASEASFRGGNLQSLSMFTTDQIWLVPVLTDHRAVLLHSAGVIFNGQGLLFVGHSDAGKSTTVTLLKDAAVWANGHSPLQVETLCDDRNIVRRWLPPLSVTGEPPNPAPLPPVAWKGEWRVYGTWSHGDVADVSSASAPLRAILFLQQDTRNEIVPLTNRKEIWKRLLATLIRPMVTAEWWQKELDVLEQVVNEVPCHTMRFDKSAATVAELGRLTANIESQSA
jgi:energy-coupling factor transporter ATP-binding protein EcfA2